LILFGLTGGGGLSGEDDRRKRVLSGTKAKRTLREVGEEGIRWTRPETPNFGGSRRTKKGTSKSFLLLAREENPDGESLSTNG